MAEALGRGGADHVMLLLDTSFLIEFEDELAHRYEATLVAREKAFERVPRLDYLSF